jgi:hypothetical protein
MEWVTPFISGRNDSATIAILTPPTVVGAVGLAGSNGWLVEEELVNRRVSCLSEPPGRLPFNDALPRLDFGGSKWVLILMFRARLGEYAYDAGAGRRGDQSPSAWA